VQSPLCPHPTRSHVVLDHNSKSQETTPGQTSTRKGERKNKRDQRGYQTGCTRYHVVRVVEEEERRLFEERRLRTLEEKKGLVRLTVIDGRKRKSFSSNTPLTEDGNDKPHSTNQVGNRLVWWVHLVLDYTTTGTSRQTS
jgi:hypothetical protein